MDNYTMEQESRQSNQSRLPPGMAEQSSLGAFEMANRLYSNQLTEAQAQRLMFGNNNASIYSEFSKMRAAMAARELLKANLQSQMFQSQSGVQPSSMNATAAASALFQSATPNHSPVMTPHPSFDQFLAGASSTSTMLPHAQLQYQQQRQQRLASTLYSTMCQNTQRSLNDNHHTFPSSYFNRDNSTSQSKCSAQSFFDLCSTTQSQQQQRADFQQSQLEKQKQMLLQQQQQQQQQQQSLYQQQQSLYQQHMKSSASAKQPDQQDTATTTPVPSIHHEKIDPQFLGEIKVPCPARGMPIAHNFKTAFFVVNDDTNHGDELHCSFPTCRNAGIKFRYCSHCKIPVARRSFAHGHAHGQDTSSKKQDRRGSSTSQSTSSSITNKDTTSPTAKTSSFQSDVPMTFCAGSSNTKRQHAPVVSDESDIASVCTSQCGSTSTVVSNTIDRYSSRRNDSFAAVSGTKRKYEHVMERKSSMISEDDTSNRQSSNSEDETSDRSSTNEDDSSDKSCTVEDEEPVDRSNVTNEEEEEENSSDKSCTLQDEEPVDKENTNEEEDDSSDESCTLQGEENDPTNESTTDDANETDLQNRSSSDSSTMDSRKRARREEWAALLQERPARDDKQALSQWLVRALMVSDDANDVGMIEGD